MLVLIWVQTVCKDYKQMTVFFFLKINSSKNYLGNTIRVSNRLDPDQDQQNVGPDLGPNCCKDYQQMTKFTASSSEERVKF